MMTLPAGWICTRLDAVADVLQGQSPPGDTYNQDRVGLPFFQGKAEFGEVYPTARKWCSKPVRIAEKGDILISIRAPVGPTNLALQRCCIGRGLAALRAPALDTSFLLQYLRHSASRLLDQATGTTFDAIGGEKLRSHEVLVAPAPEQRRIAEALDSYLTRLDSATGGLKRVEANLKRFRASVLKAAIEGRLLPTEAALAKKRGREYEPASVLLARILKERRRSWETRELARMKARGNSPGNDTWKAKYREPAAPDTGNLPDLPEGWCWATVEMVGDVLLGRQRAPQFLTGRFDTPYLRVANIKDDRIDLSDIESMDFDREHFHRYRLAPGDILVSEGQSPHLVGQSAIFRGEGPARLCFQKTLHRFRPVAGGPSSEFAQLVFRAHVKAGLFQRLASITTNIAHLTLEKFQAAPFPLPPVSEQERIATEVARILSEGDAVEAAVVANVERIAHLRQSILKWAFEGKLVEQDPGDEPASVLIDKIRKDRMAVGTEAKRLAGGPARKTA